MSNDNDDRRLFVRLNEDAENPWVKPPSSHTSIVSPAIHEDSQERPRSKSPPNHPNRRWLSGRRAKDGTASMSPNDIEMQTPPNVRGSSINVQSVVDVHRTANERG